MYLVTTVNPGKFSTRNEFEVEWKAGDTKLVSEERLNFFLSHPDVFTVTKVTATGDEMNALIGGPVSLPDALAGKQDANANLGSLSLLGTAADKVAYTTAVDTWAEAVLTAAGRALLAGATADDQLTSLGATAAGKALLLGATADAQLTSLGATAAGKALLLDATAIDQLASLGVTAAAADINQTSGISGPAFAGQNVGDRVERERVAFANSGTAAADVTVAVTFAAAFVAAPVVTLGAETSLGAYISTPSSTTGVSVTVPSVPAATTVYVNLIII